MKTKASNGFEFRTVKVGGLGYRVQVKMNAGGRWQDLGRFSTEEQAAQDVERQIVAIKGGKR